MSRKLTVVLLSMLVLAGAMGLKTVVTAHGNSQQSFRQPARQFLRPFSRTRTEVSKSGIWAPEKSRDAWSRRLGHLVPGNAF